MFSAFVDGGERDMAYTFSHRCGESPKTWIICWPDIPLAPATITRNPLNFSGVVGRPWKIPFDWIVRVLGEDIVVDVDEKLLGWVLIREKNAVFR